MAIEIIKITDYDVNLQLLLQQYKNKPRFKSILEASNNQADDLEDGLFEIRDDYWVTTATGVQLDTIGEIVGEERNGRNDTDYRQAILFRIQTNYGSGEPETVIFVFTNIYGATNCQLLFVGNATLQVYTDVIIDSQQFNDLLDIIPSGVGLYVIFGSDNPFVFDTDPDGEGFTRVNSEQLTFSNGDKLIFSNGDKLVMYDRADPAIENAGGEFQAIFQS